VVKSQRIDIARVILVLIRGKTVSARCVTTGNHGLSGSPHLRIIGLPRNPMECAIFFGLMDLSHLWTMLRIDHRRLDNAARYPQFHKPQQQGREIYFWQE
jgi:hypothetical protein